MQFAANKYKALVQTGEWQAPSAEQSELLALQAQVASQTKQIKDLKAGRPSRRSNAKKDKGKNASAKGRQTLKPKKDAIKSATKYATWKTTYPGDHKKTTPVTDERGIKWWWCGPQTGGKCHGIYRNHKPEDCQGSRYRPPQKTSKGKGSKAKLDKVKTIMTAMQTVLEQASSTYANSDSEMDEHK